MGKAEGGSVRVDGQTRLSLWGDARLAWLLAFR